MQNIKGVKFSLFLRKQTYKMIKIDTHEELPNLVVFSITTFLQLLDKSDAHHDIAPLFIRPILMFTLFPK